MLYEMISGAPPFEGRNYFELLWKHGNEPPPSMAERNPNVYAPEAVEKVVAKALAKDREERFATMEELEHALMDAAPEIPSLPPLPSLPPERPSSMRSIPPRASTPGRSSDARRAPAETMSEVALPTRRRWSVLALVAGAALVIGAVGYTMAGGSSEDTEPTANAPRDTPRVTADETAEPASAQRGDPATDDTTPAVADDTPPVGSEANPATPAGVDPPLPAPISVHLTSVPDGAEVRLGDRTLGTTPLVAPLEASETAVRLTFSRPGYLSETISIVPREGLDVPAVRLRRRRRATSTSSGVDLPIKTGL